MREYEAVYSLFLWERFTEREASMRAIELTAEVDVCHRLQVALPESVLPGKVRVIVLTPEPDEDKAGQAWMQGVSR